MTDDRQARLAAALRANLRRRKAAAPRGDARSGEADDPHGERKVPPSGSGESDPKP